MLVLHWDFSSLSSIDCHQAVGAPNLSTVSTALRYRLPSHTDAHETHWRFSLGDTQFSFSFSSILVFERRALLALLGKCSTTWVVPPSLFALVCFSDRVSHFFQAGLVPRSSYFYLWVGGIIDMHYHTYQARYLILLSSASRTIFQDTIV
jgi:hypothetical protein